MIYAVQGNTTTGYEKLVDDMFRLRARVFDERLGWEVQVSNGRELDQFDLSNPLYLLSVGKEGQLNGCLRLLPTTGPNMLRDVFSGLLNDSKMICSPYIWESTRFCVAHSALEQRSGNNLNYTTGELLAGIVEVGMLAGLDYVVSVYDARMRRILRTAGCAALEVGTPKKFGKVKTYAGLFRINETTLKKIQTAAGIEDWVLFDKHADNVATVA